ncbi:MAG TPA: alpha-amylase/4-alpha-glucanotransferase domain-containing protein [Thermodesulfovibrionales bacterium]|nr:alpha-amylase/4-alpha-glucanotransferase domain-containing protein [Thermodesulfovibrionales bacterium]
MLAFHNHQPVGNFDHVIEDAYRKAYLPLLELLRRHPSIKVVLHYSGNLLCWMERKHPEAMDILKGFVKARRVEFLSGGFYEPILSVLPEVDRVIQVRELTEYIDLLLNYKARGLWLAERVWEPQMPRYLCAAGVEYFPLDDYHFKLSGLEDRDLSGYFMTEDNGSCVSVFPGSEKLRYYIPFRDVEEILSYLSDFRSAAAAQIQGAPLITMADDGEKFGVWPETHEHCYEDGWLERFFSALESNSHWIETTTFSRYRAAFRPIGKVYLPTASYREMGEWVLPPEKGIEYEQALGEMEKLFGERAKGMLRGGIWRSFLSKYPESNHIHKRMLMISGKAHEAIKQFKVQGSKSKGQKTDKTRSSLLHELWKGQCNDAYWHGIFGGLYLPHLRSSLYRHLIAAESRADEMLNTGKGTKEDGAWKVEGDTDCDGYRDMCIGNNSMTAFFTEQGGHLLELSLKKSLVNVLDILTRRPEAYHSRLCEAVEDQGGTRTIHERLCVKEAGLSEHLIYDKYRRASLIDHFFGGYVDPESLRRGSYEEMGDFVSGIYDMNYLRKKDWAQVKLDREGVAAGRPLRVVKTVRFHESRIAGNYTLGGNYSGVFGIEFNISLLGSPYASISVDDKRLHIRDSGAHEGIKVFSIRDDFLNLELAFTFDEDIYLCHYPVETVSLSEEGVERIYQGTAFMFMKRLDFNGTKRLGFTMDFRETK